ncbi:MAG: hypothetical protein AAB431_02165 [Patescibacteria group bacterium]
MDSHEHSESCSHTAGSTRNRFYISALILVLVAVFGYMSYAKKAEVTKEEQAAVATEPLVPAEEAAARTYKNGTYSATGKYISPGGPEEFPVSLTITDDVITAAEVAVNSERPISQKFQGMFIADYKTFVVGKKVDEVNLTKVSGSSLTPKGFNDALAQIKTQAQS